MDVVPPAGYAKSMVTRGRGNTVAVDISCIGDVASLEFWTPDKKGNTGITLSKTLQCSGTDEIAAFVDVLRFVADELERLNG